MDADRFDPMNPFRLELRPIRADGALGDELLVSDHPRKEDALAESLGDGFVIHRLWNTITGESL